jgi:Tfp pilus assembly protein FimT
MSKKGGKTSPYRTCLTGFHMHEMLVALSIASIITGIGVPGVQFLVFNSKLKTGANGLVSARNLSRSEAVTQSTPLSVCSNSNRAECRGKPWNEDRIVSMYENVKGMENANGMVDGSDALLLVSADVDVSLSGPAYPQFPTTEGLVNHCDDDCLNGNTDAPYADHDYSNTLPLLIRLLPGTAVYASESGGSQVQGATETLVSEKSSREHGAGLGQGGVVDLSDDGTTTEDSEDTATSYVSTTGSGLGPSPSFATFQLCNGGTGRTITVNSTGRVKVADSSC